MRCAIAEAQTKAVEAAIQAFENAVMSADAKQFEQLLTDDFELVHGTGVVDSREAYLAKARSGQLSMQRMEVARFDTTLALHGDTDAVVATYVRENGVAWRAKRAN